VEVTSSRPEVEVLGATDEGWLIGVSDAFAQGPSWPTQGFSKEIL
jgi:methenyltetrahydromethanopterin cyclohydrolase